MTALDHKNKEIFDLIEKAKDILLLTDERIDGDTTGATLAMYHWLTSIGKTVRVFSPKPWANEYHFLPGYEAVSFDVQEFDQPTDLVMVFDCADGAYLDAFRSTKAMQAPLVVFDHHATNPRYGNVNQIIPEASSSGEVIWRFFKTNHVPIEKEAATCLMTAICTDTTLFSNPATNQVCMQAASELGLAGARVQDVVRAMYMNKSVEMLRTWGLVLERLQDLPGGIIVTYLLAKDKIATGVDDVDTSAISNFLIGMVGNAKVIAVLSEKDDGSVKASLRTIEGDVAAIAARYGGGGHIKAAGFSLPHARLQEGDGGWKILKDEGPPIPVADILKA